VNLKSINSVDWNKIAGPNALGRSLLTQDIEIPEPWADSKCIELNAVSILDRETLEDVRSSFFARERVVFRIAKNLDKPMPGFCSDDVWDIQPNFNFVAEAIWRLATMNAIDARDSADIYFPLARLAISRGALDGEETGADVILENKPMWCDGGPLYLWGNQDERLMGFSAIPRLNIRNGTLAPISNAELVAELANDQNEAVSVASSRARIIAPAGSGKTRVLVERVGHLVRSGVPVTSILILAYNKRAEEEIRERTKEFGPVEIRTIDALALALVNGSRGFLESVDRRTTISEFDVRRIISDLVKFPRVANVDPVAPWLSALSDARLGLLSPTDVEEKYDGDVNGFAEFYPLFREHLRENKLADFNEYIVLAVEKLLSDPSARFGAEARHEVLLVDEFQDLTAAHVLMLRLLAGPTLSIFAVGDDDQTIYGFNGATPEWLVNFDKYVPSAEKRALEVNYRCPEFVVSAASNLLTHNQFRVVKLIRAARKFSSNTESLLIRADKDQPRLVVQHLRSLLSKGERPADMAVLSRVNIGNVPVIIALLEAGIPVNYRETEKLLTGSSLESALAWLRLATNPGSMSSHDLMHAARRPGRGISPNVLAWIGEQKSLQELQSLQKRLNDKSSKKVEAFIADIENLIGEAVNGSTASVLEFLKSSIGLGAIAASLDKGRGGGVKSSNSDGFRCLEALAQMHPEVASFESWIRENLARGGSSDGVVVSTVHKVKGLEWRNVVVYDATEGVFPHRLSNDLEEERRVFHVALTRCLESLLITTEDAARSNFLDEIVNPFQDSRSSETEVRTTSGVNQFAHAREIQIEFLTVVVGLKFYWNGARCVVEAVNNLGAVVEVSKNRVTVEFGSRVIIDGKYRILKDGSLDRDHADFVMTQGQTKVVEELHEALRQWRLSQAMVDNVPAFFIFGNKVLDELCAKRPRTLSELAGVKGIGPMKIEQFGDAILSVIVDTVPEEMFPLKSITSAPTLVQVGRSIPHQVPEDRLPIRAAIKEWRKGKSSELRVPAYVIFSDRTLDEISDYCPTTRSELLKMYGIGEARADAYGEEIIELIKSIVATD